MAKEPTPAELAWRSLYKHPLFRSMMTSCGLEQVNVKENWWAKVTKTGTVRVNLNNKTSKHEGIAKWEKAIAHELCHLGLGHLSGKTETSSGYARSWQAAACVDCEKLLRSLGYRWSNEELPSGSLRSLWETWRDRSGPEHMPEAPGGETGCLVYEKQTWRQPRFEEHFAKGVAEAAKRAVDVAGGRIAALQDQYAPSGWQAAKEHLINSRPLLGGMISACNIVEDAEACKRLGIDVAACSGVEGIIWLNPDVPYNAVEKEFILAHEALHLGLQHGGRTGGRDPFVWNLACDFVVNAWLNAMGVGSMPGTALFDKEFDKMSCEEVYDILYTDWRKWRKCRTFKGSGCDIVVNDAGDGRWDDIWARVAFDALDAQGINGRGYLPEGLVAAIKSLNEAPPRWDVELAKWVSDHVRQNEPNRSYVRMSRRQSSTPDIPRPGHVYPEAEQETFAVVVDTSGSMSHTDLGRALGAIASYAMGRDVKQLRVVWCDAEAYDAGMVAPEELLGRVEVTGRGGTVMQPALDLLERDSSWPKKAPILIVTDGWTDNFKCSSEHAVLLTGGGALLHRRSCPVFRMGDRPPGA